MKRFVAILLLLISFSFAAEQAWLTAAHEWHQAMEQDAMADTGEEQKGNAQEDLKEKYCSSFFSVTSVPDVAMASADRSHLHHYPSGFITKPYMPPEVI